MLRRALVPTVCLILAASCSSDDTQQVPETSKKNQQLPLLTFTSAESAEESGETSEKSSAPTEVDQEGLAQQVDQEAWARCSKDQDDVPSIVIIRANQPLTTTNVQNSVYIEIHANQPITTLTLAAPEGTPPVHIPRICLLVRANQPNTRIELKGVELEHLEYEVHANQPILEVEADEGSAIQGGRIETHTNQSRINLTGKGSVGCSNFAVEGDGNQNKFNCASDSN